MSRHDLDRTLPWMREGIAFLETQVAALTDDELQASSALPGWTRAHVVGARRPQRRGADPAGRLGPHGGRDTAGPRRPDRHLAAGTGGRVPAPATVTGSAAELVGQLTGRVADPTRPPLPRWL
ncbi:maleylpyruvate isomerase N-terminal domain-containing protein [Pseudonocardia halophobica]|uniref:maleylpyruvate isomerase N-terminal domain-containing protein n=1 Tax=Pseudonocardia halophobica TaxID=29401 RepID=UPI003D8F04D0